MSSRISAGSWACAAARPLLPSAADKNSRSLRLRTSSLTINKLTSLSSM
jgi:hypothetical protein